MKGLSVKNIISIKDLRQADIQRIFKLSAKLKRARYKGKQHRILHDKTLAMIFAKPSTRTRVSFEVGMTQLGGHAIDLADKHLQLGHGETIEDTAHVLGRYVDFIMARLFDHNNIVQLAAASKVPVINGLTDLLHPIQVLSDMFTILEKKGKLKGLRLAFIGDGSDNVGHSLMYACDKLDIKMRIGCPEKYMPDKKILADTKNSVQITHSASVAAKDADIIYTDSWVSMGQEKQAEKKKQTLRSYQVNSKLLKHAKKDAIVMHPLPAHRGYEITDKIMDGPQSVILDQAENRLHVQKAILVLLNQKR